MSKNTVFIIGAGASKEAGLPTGNELKEKISKLLNIKFDFRYGNRPKSGDLEIAEALRLHVKQTNVNAGDINPYLKEAWHIKKALPLEISIDNFLDKQRGNTKITLCGKLGIVQAILGAEKNSLLYFEEKEPESTIDFESLEKTWYVSFFKLLTENCAKEDLEERFKSVTLIIFNYDRCVEHFIYNALQNSYNISETEAAELVNKINIYHPYGNVGSLPWSKNGINSSSFGSDPMPEQLLTLAKKIKTFTEGTDPKSSKIIKIHEKMSEANKLVFLGFAFHKLNMELIKPANFKNAPIECFATILRVSYSDSVIIEKQIRDLYNGNVNIQTSDSTCNSFFEKFWRSLGF